MPTGIKSYSEHARPNIDCPMESMDDGLENDWWLRECNLQNKAMKLRLS